MFLFFITTPPFTAIALARAAVPHARNAAGARFA
jgi:hypothetical protein